MSDKDGIDCLKLYWYSNEDENIVDFKFEKDILDKLRPQSNLKQLEIKGYRGTIFPDWLGHSSHHNITKVTLAHCRNCRMLPPLGQLPSLKHLFISKFSKLEIVGAEFYGDDVSCLETPFPMLETLWFDSMPCWKEWHSLELSAFPRLRSLSIGECPMLREDLSNHLPSLKSLVKLEIWGCRKLEFKMDGQQHSLQELSIMNSCDSVTSFSLLDAFPNLMHVQIRNCEKMESIVVSRSLSCLRYLSIYSCGSLKSVSMLWMATPQLEYLGLVNCPEMDLSLVTGDPPCSLRYLEISYSDKLGSAATLMNSQFHGLAHLTIHGNGKCESVKSFPKEGWLPASLESLALVNIESMETLESKGLAHLTSLQLLYIYYCLQLENIDGEKLPASLKRLLIENCRLKDPQVWPKISHTRDIEVLITDQFPNPTT
ncbi:hypothetical protein PIB30_109918 [Stylosanthes scabra]|uniref:Uncharacterized protein n=1 Tax=Stylosanthes scabra TaxID=79078 RepID=A0ABU6V2B3_9FABA|nr:hypothetical protein [Stylosanthes scabra]